MRHKYAVKKCVPYYWAQNNSCRPLRILLDDTEANASDLAKLFHKRRTIETTLAELKTTLKDTDIVLRSTMPLSGLNDGGRWSWPRSRGQSTRARKVEAIRACSNDDANNIRREKEKKY